MTDTSTRKNLAPALLFTRLSIVAFLAPWFIKKAMNIEMTKGLFAKYYFVKSMPEAVAYIIGGLGLALLFAFLIGFKKKISYGLILLWHAGGTLLALPYMIPGTEKFNLLFMAAIPAIGAMLLLYILRDEDTLLSLK